MSVEEAASWALKHLYHEDRANAAMHCAAVRFSPITFRLAEALRDIDPTDEIVAEVLMHRGTYAEDPGR